MQWEYKTIRFDRRGFIGNRINTDELDRKLNARGVTGSSHFLGIMSEIVAVLKRPKD